MNTGKLMNYCFTTFTMKQCVCCHRGFGKVIVVVKARLRTDLCDCGFAD